MNISPRRRRRILREHQLRQNGHTLEQIAKKVDISVATVHADLRVLETNWTEFAQATRKDLLLQQINRLNRLITRLTNRKPFADDGTFTVEQIISLETLLSRDLNAANREYRLLLRELRADAPHNDEIIELELSDYPDHELADPERTRKNLKEPETNPAAIPQKTQEIASPPPPEKEIPENLKVPLPKHTGRNKPCPCGSGRKRKLCHPQHSSSPPSEVSSSPPAGEMSRSSLPPARPGDRGGLPPGLEAESRTPHPTVRRRRAEQRPTHPGQSARKTSRPPRQVTTTNSHQEPPRATKGLPGSGPQNWTKSRTFELRFKLDI